MEWKKYVLTTTTQAVELLESVLMDNGIDSFEVEDRQPISLEDQKEMYIDIVPELKDDGIARLIFYLDGNIAPEEEQRLLDGIRAGVEEYRGCVDVGEGSLKASVTREEDYINRWKEYFKPFTVGDILIRPTWEQAENEEAYAMVIRIDPGTAFGTGLHETTQLCIRQLEKYIKPGEKSKSVLDVGCGSGILSIIAAKLGAGTVLGIDIDERAVKASKENVIENEVADNITFLEGNFLQDEALQKQVGTEAYDVVVANILADVIIPLSGMIGGFLKPGGVFIASGIIDSKEQQVLAAMKENTALEVTEITRQKEWVSFTAIKR